MADDPDIPWLEKYKREGENAGKCWESKEGHMNSGGELPVIIFIIWIHLGQIHG